MKRLVPVLAVLLLILFAGCSSGSSTKSAASTTTTVASSTGNTGAKSSSSSYVTTAEAAVAAAYKGLYTEPTATGPKAQTGKDIWVISCDQALPGCSEPTAGVQQAAKVLGWHVTVANGMGTPAGYTAAIDQAIAAKAQGIIDIAIDCPDAKSALQEAKAKHIPTVGVYSYDCNDPKANDGPALYSALINTNGTPDQFGLLWGKLKADYAIAATDGKAKVINLYHNSFYVSEWQNQGFKTELAKCSGCSIVANVNVTAADLGDPSTTAQLVATVLQQHPTANVLEVPDDTTLEEAAQVIKEDKPAGMTVIGGEGYPATLALVAAGTVSAEVAIPANWLGWSGADAMNRVLAGETKIPNEGVSFEIITKQHNLPAAGQGWTPTVNYEAAFTKEWKG